MNILIEQRDDDISGFIWAERCRSALNSCIEVIAITDCPSSDHLIGTGDNLDSMENCGLTKFSQFSIYELDFSNFERVVDRIVNILTSSSGQKRCLFWKVDIFKIYQRASERQKKEIRNALKTCKHQNIFVSMKYMNKFSYVDYLELFLAAEITRWEGLCLCIHALFNQINKGVELYGTALPAVSAQLIQAFSTFNEQQNATEASPRSFWGIIDAYGINYHQHDRWQAKKTPDFYKFIVDKSIFINSQNPSLI